MRYQVKAVNKLLVFLLILLAATPALAQNTDLNKRITIVSKGRPLGDVLNELSEKTGLLFSFSNDQLDVTKSVSLSMKNKATKDVFEKLFTSQGLEYMMIDNQVVLKIPKKKPEEEKSKTKSKYTISGTLKDKETGETLIGATVWINGTSTGVVTNNYGFYSLTLEEGDYTVVYSSIGFVKQIMQVELTKNKKIDLHLNFDNSLLQEIVITADEKEAIKPSNDLARIDIHPRTVSDLPGFMGETELIKTLQAVPGFKSFGDGSAIFYVRGGNRDQNMIMIDDAPVYNPAHLFGFFTSFIPDAIKDIKVYKGDIPISMGGGMSSVIDIACNDGNLNTFSMNGSIGMITNRLSLETPIKKEKSSLFISMRNSHLEMYLPKEVRDEMKVGFYDLHLKFNVRLNDKNRIYLSGYYGGDDYTNAGLFSASSIKWTNAATSLRWTHVFSSKLFSNTTMYASVYNYYLYLNSSGKDYWNTYIANNTLKTDFTWYLNKNNTIRFGLNFTGHQFNPGNLQMGVAKKYLIPELPLHHARHRVLYIGNEQKLHEKLQVKYGVRLNFWRNVGESTAYIYDNRFNIVDSIYAKANEVFNKKLIAEPRISIEYKLRKDILLSAAYNRNCQFLQLLSNSVSPFTSLEVWYPSTMNIEPQQSDQVSLGINKVIKDNKYRFTMDIYHKWMYNQIEYTEHANMLMNDQIEGELRLGTVRAYGVETMYKKTTGKLMGWISYTYSRALVTNEFLNKGTTYPASFDRPHDFTLAATYKPGKRWQFAAQWVYATGSAFTSPVGFYQYQGSIVPLYNFKNNDRLPDYHRMDLSATWQINRTNDHKYRHNLVFSIYNVYNRKNPIAINFNKVKIDGSYVTPTNVYMPPMADPTMVYLIGIMPSITYNFKF